MMNPKETSILRTVARDSAYTTEWAAAFKHWFLHSVEFDPEIWRILNEEKIESISITQCSDPDGEMKIKCCIKLGDGYELYETELSPKVNFEFPKELFDGEKI